MTWYLLFLTLATFFLSSHTQLMVAKNLPRIGRAPHGFIWKSTIPGPAYDRSTRAEGESPGYDRHSRGYAGDEYFLKAAKSVPRIGRRNDGGFLKAGKSIPRIGRRDEYDNQEVAVPAANEKRAFEAMDDQMGGYYGGGYYANDDHWMYKRNSPADHDAMF